MILCQRGRRTWDVPLDQEHTYSEILLGGRNPTWLWIREIPYLSIIPFLYIYMIIHVRQSPKHMSIGWIILYRRTGTFLVMDILLFWMFVSTHIISQLIDERKSFVAVPCCSFSINGIPSLLLFCGGSNPSKGGHLVILWWSPRYPTWESIEVQTGTASRAATETARHRPWKMLGKTNCSDQIEWCDIAEESNRQAICPSVLAARMCSAIP